MPFRMTTLAVSLLLAACAGSDSFSPLDNYTEVQAATILDAPSIAHVAPENREMVDRGEYLVELLGCGACHTDGALIGEPDVARSLAGSSIGIAYTSPFENENPGIVFAPNLTPDRDTGIGRWTDDEIREAIQAGLGRHGPNRILVMPWQAYARVSDNDARAIVAYLRSLDPIENTVPVNVPMGRETERTYVHFGVYRSKGLPRF